MRYLFCLSQTAQNIIEVGKRLIQAKSLVAHGHWQDWLQLNFQLKERMAQNFMQCAERYGKTHLNADLNQTQMIALLALPDAAETEKFLAEKAAEDKNVADMTIKQLHEEIDQPDVETPKPKLEVAAQMVIDDRTDAKIWILKNQLGRRNLIPAVRIKIALLVEENIAQKAKARQAEYHGNQYQSAVTDKCPEVQNTEPPKRDRQAERENTTNYQLAKMAGVSDKTVQRYKKIIKEAPQEIVAQVDTGEMSINEGYNKLKNAARIDDIKQQAADIKQTLSEKLDGLFNIIVLDPPVFLRLSIMGSRLKRPHRTNRSGRSKAQFCGG